MKDKNENIKRQNNIYKNCKIVNLNIDGFVLILIVIFITIIKPELFSYLLNLIKLCYN